MQTLNRDSVLRLYERLTSLVEKLPGAARKPILRELTPIRELFLEQRPARVLVLGGAAGTTVPALLRIVCDADVETGEARDGWRTYRVADRGAVEVLDARGSLPDGFYETAIGGSIPDVVVFLRGPEDDAEAFGSEFESALDRLNTCAGAEDVRPGVVAVSIGDGEAGRARLRALLNSRREFSQRGLHVLAAESGGEGIAEAVCGELPNPARLEFARMSGARAAQAAIAMSLLKSFTAVCGVIGMQPIPLADMPILMTLQTLMVGLVVYVSGRKASPRLIAEFTAALGVNLGAGFAFREGARALLKVFPLWGNAISGIVAGAGTYAIGRASIAYFIEDLPLQETRKLFRRLQPGLESFKRNRLRLPGRRKKD